MIINVIAFVLVMVIWYTLGFSALLIPMNHFRDVSGDVLNDLEINEIQFHIAMIGWPIAVVWFWKECKRARDDQQS